jgi:hypothetical protein
MYTLYYRDIPLKTWTDLIEIKHDMLDLSITYYRRKKNWRENEKTANIEKAVTFFLEEIEQKFKQIWKGV